MPLREDILKPIAGDNPSGRNLRLEPVYDRIREARREDDDLNKGVWETERKVADFDAVVKLASDAIATESKDLQLAAWLCEALLRKRYARGAEDGPERSAILRLQGFREGLELCRTLVSDFWDTLYPVMEDGDAEDRATALAWVGSKMAFWVKSLPLARGEYNYFSYKESRGILYEDRAKSKEEKTSREKALKDGKLAPELFDKSFSETPKAFYVDLEKTIDTTAGSLTGLDKICDERFPAGSGPSFAPLKQGLAEFRQVVHSLLQKKRETEPDPVEVVPQVETATESRELAAAAAAAASYAGPVSLFGGSSTATAFQAIEGYRSAAEPADQREAITNIVAAASMLRRLNPHNPAPYLMLRGFRWGELRGSSDPWVLEAPPSDIRQQVKGLALEGRWADLLELAENVMALPCSRAWLDLQRFVVDACVALGSDYNAVAIAIRSELRALLRDLPQLIDAVLTDDTPAANPQTQAWLKELVAEPASATPQKEPPRIPVMENGSSPGWQKKFVDAHALALQAMRSGKAEQAVSILKHEIEQQLSGRGRFQRKLQLAQICIAAGKDAIAQPLLDDLSAAIETHKLEDWEDREMVAGALTFLLQNSKKIQADAKAKQAIFERICRLDPVQALTM